MQTDLLYQTDSYLKEFDASVVKPVPEESAVLLDRTAFFPGGGGQPADKGLLEIDGNQSDVIKVKWSKGGVLHQVDSPLPGVGSGVSGKIDWDRRYALMRTHTALHILCGVIWREWRAQVTGGNMEPLRGRLDFEFERLTGDMIRLVEAKLREEVAACRDVKIAFINREEANRNPDLIRTKVNLLPDSLTEIRTIEIAGLDIQADGGTHVHNTGEVGGLKISNYKSKGRINKRIEITLES